MDWDKAEAFLRGYAKELRLKSDAAFRQGNAAAVIEYELLIQIANMLAGMIGCAKTG